MLNMQNATEDTTCMVTSININHFNHRSKSNNGNVNHFHLNPYVHVLIFHITRYPLNIIKCQVLIDKS